MGRTPHIDDLPALLDAQRLLVPLYGYFPQFGLLLTEHHAPVVFAGLLVLTAGEAGEVLH